MPRISVRTRALAAVATAATLGTLAVGASARAATTPAIANAGPSIAIATETPDHGLELRTKASIGSPPVTQTVAGPGTTYSAPSLIQTGFGQVAIAAEGRNHSLLYYRKVGGSWIPQLVAGAFSTYSAPSAARDGSITVIAAEGLGATLQFYQPAGGGWAPAQTIAGLASSVTAPSVTAAGGQVIIAAQALGGYLRTYWSSTLSSWSSAEAGGFGSTVSAPSLTHDGGLLLLAAQGPGNSLQIYRSSLGLLPAWIPVPTGGVAYSTPSVSVTPGGLYRYNVAVQGQNHNLLDYHSANAVIWTPRLVAGSSSTYSAPSAAYYSFFSPYFNVITAAGPAFLTGHSLRFYYENAPGPWFAQTLPGLVA